ncbi:hypothetical protein SLS56_000114 [Neofusicoccum ribis]|uniref:Uncharacterized protein n=1 Tax=Neofusicoccum ribis TaxID=45134 RepID=A0ABR3TFX9_9PEZI
MLVNHVTKYHVALRALEVTEKRDGDMRLEFVEKYTDFQHRTKKKRDCIYANGQDPEGTYDLPAFEDFTKGSGGDGSGGGGGGVLSDEGCGSNVTMLRCEFDRVVQYRAETAVIISVSPIGSLLVALLFFSRECGRG